MRENLHININNSDIDIAHRLGTNKSQNNSRPVIVKLQSRQAKYIIMNACVTVKPNLYVNESLTTKRRSLFKIVLENNTEFQQCYKNDGKIVSKLKHSNRKHIITTDETLADFLVPVFKGALNTQT